MRVNPILSSIVFKSNTESNKRRRLNRYSLIPITGYTSIGFGIASGIFGHRKNIVVHKVAAMVALAAAVAHILLLKTMHLVGRQKKS